MKQKTLKTARKRIKLTGTGKLQRRKISAQHLADGKSKRTLKNRTKIIAVSRADSQRIRKLIPNR